jgi:hypothetical protein
VFIFYFLDNITPGPWYKHVCMRLSQYLPKNNTLVHQNAKGGIMKSNRPIRAIGQQP